MFGPNRSFLRSSQLTVPQLHSFFKDVAALKANVENGWPLDNLLSRSPRERVATLLFLEPSTRTRMSFEMACLRLGVQVSLFGDASNASTAKGETAADTFLNLKSMEPDVMIIRHGGDGDLETVIENSDVPVINAGQGAVGHPTQALLDAFTIQEAGFAFKDVRVLFVGDLKYSRVAHSDIELFQRLGMQVGAVCPAHLRWDEQKDIRYFQSLADGLKWSNVAMGLRIQKERHGAEATKIDLDEYVRAFRLDRGSLQNLAKDAFIMHPGPFVPMVDMHPEVLKDPRCLVHKQVTNGVYVRMVLLAIVLGLWKGSFNESA